MTPQIVPANKYNESNFQFLPIFPLLFPTSKMEVDKQSLWLLHLLQLIHGVSVLTQWKPLSAIALLSGLYVLVHQLRNPPAGNCADVYGFGCILSNVVLSLCTDILFRDADDFTRVERVTVPDSHEKNSDNRSTARTPWQKVVDVLELGFASSRGIGWYVLSIL